MYKIEVTWKFGIVTTEFLTIDGSKFMFFIILGQLKILIYTIIVSANLL